MIRKTELELFGSDDDKSDHVMVEPRKTLYALELVNFQLYMMEHFSRVQNHHEHGRLIDLYYDMYRTSYTDLGRTSVRDEPSLLRPPVLIDGVGPKMTQPSFQALGAWLLDIGMAEYVGDDLFVGVGTPTLECDEAKLGTDFLDLMKSYWEARLQVKPW